MDQNKQMALAQKKKTRSSAQRSQHCRRCSGEISPCEKRESNPQHLPKCLLLWRKKTKWYLLRDSNAYTLNPNQDHDVMKHLFYKWVGAVQKAPLCILLRVVLLSEKWHLAGWATFSPLLFPRVYFLSVLACFDMGAAGTIIHIRCDAIWQAPSWIIGE